MNGLAKVKSRVILLEPSQTLSVSACFKLRETTGNVVRELAASEQ
jgi:hypothetical protein